jgi:hypothetical protein
MRTKTLLLTAALGAVGIATSMAQVFSENSVGYYVKDLPMGFSLIANQLNNGDNNLNTILPLSDDFTGAQLLKWDSANQTFFPADDFFGSAFGGWVDANFAPTATTLSPGEGAFINLPSAASLTFVGEVPQGDLSVPISQFFSIISQPTPQALGVGSTPDVSGADDIPALVGDQILFWDNQATPQTFKAALDYFGSDFGGWVDANFTPVNPTPEVGEAFFYNSAATSPVSWDRSFSVN